MLALHGGYVKSARRPWATRDAECGQPGSPRSPFPYFCCAPALWNGYPLLQYDTGGYIARWYEGYLVPSRSTVFGYYLHLGEDAHFWINIKLQALATLWILQRRSRVSA